MDRGNVVITGISTGIGLATARKFLQENYRVFGSVRKQKDATRLSDSLGPNLVPLLFDVTDHKAIAKEADKVSNLVGEKGVSLLINNAGIAVNGPVADLELDDYQFQFDVNFFGLIATTKAFLPLLGATKGSKYPPGKIFNISSVSGEISYPFMSPYVASKHAVEGFSKSLRQELLLFGVDVIIIGPGATKTPIWDKVEPFDEKLFESDYGEILVRFRSQIMKESEDAMDADLLAHKIFDIFIDNKPRTRYAILKNKFTRWTLPRYLLSDRQVDNFVRKIFGI